MKNKKYFNTSSATNLTHWVHFFEEMGFEKYSDKKLEQDNFNVVFHLEDELNDPKIPCFYLRSIEEKWSFQNYLPPLFLSTEMGKNIVARMLETQERFHLTSFLSQDFENIFTLRVRDYLFVGSYIDKLVKAAYLAGVDYFKVRQQLNELMPFVLELLHRKEETHPLEVSFSYNHFGFAINFSSWIKTLDLKSEFTVDGQFFERFVKNNNFIHLDYSQKAGRLEISLAWFKDNLSKVNVAFLNLSQLEKRQESIPLQPSLFLNEEMNFNLQSTRLAKDFSFKSWHFEMALFIRENIIKTGVFRREELDLTKLIDIAKEENLNEGEDFDRHQALIVLALLYQDELLDQFNEFKNEKKNGNLKEYLDTIKNKVLEQPHFFKEFDLDVVKNKFQDLSKSDQISMEDLNALLGATTEGKHPTDKFKELQKHFQTQVDAALFDHFKQLKMAEFSLDVLNANLKKVEELLHQEKQKNAEIRSAFLKLKDEVLKTHKKLKDREFVVAAKEMLFSELPHLQNIENELELKNKELIVLGHKFELLNKKHEGQLKAIMDKTKDIIAKKDREIDLLKMQRVGLDEKLRSELDLQKKLKDLNQFPSTSDDSKQYVENKELEKIKDAFKGKSLEETLKPLIKEKNILEDRLKDQTHKFKEAEHKLKLALNQIEDLSKRTRSDAKVGGLKNAENHLKQLDLLNSKVGQLGDDLVDKKKEILKLKQENGQLILKNQEMERRLLNQEKKNRAAS